MDEPAGAEGYRLSWTTEYRDLRDAFAWNLFRRWRLMRYLRIALFVLAALWLVSTVATGRFTLVGGIEFAVVVLLLAVAPDLATWTFWRANAPSLRRGSAGAVDGAGLTITNGGTSSRLTWSEIGRLEETRRVWLFRLARSKNLVMVPKRAVPGPEEEFAAYVGARLEAVDNGTRGGPGTR